MRAAQPSQQTGEPGYTPDEQRNIDLARDYMEIAYTPGRAGARAVKHLCAPGNRFVAPTTFPNVHTLEDYAEDHGRLMEQVNDLRIVSFDVLFAKADRVCLRYTAEAAIAASRTATLRPPAAPRAGRRPPCSGFGTASSPSSSRTGTSCRCGSSWAGRWRSA